MKKRILAMLLTVCMLVLAVPVFALPAAAATPAYTTKWTDNIPEDSAFTTHAGAVEWINGWSFVGYNRWQTPGEAIPQANFSGLWVAPPEGTGSVWDGVVTHGGYYTGVNVRNSNKDDFGSIGSIVAASRSCDQSVNSKGGTAGIRYTAESTGIIDIYFEKLGNDATNTAGNFTYYLYIDGQKVQTWTLTKVAGEENWVYSTKTLVAGDVSIRKGQHIEFLCDTENLGYDGAPGNSGNCLFPVIEYSFVDVEADAGTYTTSYNDTTNTPKHNGSNGVSYFGNWAVKTTRNNVGTYNYSDLIDINWAGTSGNYANLATSGGEAFLTWGNTNGNYHGKLGTFGATQTQAVVLRYSSEKSGTADIYFDLLGNVAAKASGTFTYTVYVNGTKVWPLNGETNTVVCANNGTHVLYNEPTLAVPAISLNAGDRVDFVCEATGVGNSGVNELWGAGGNAMFPTIKFTSINNNVKTFNSDTNVPVINEDKTVTFNGGFIPVAYEKGENGFDFTDPSAALLMDTQTSLWGAGNGIAPAAPHLAWANKAHMVIKAFNANYFNQVGQICVTGKMAGGLRYVAEETGTVDIDFAMLGVTAPLSGGIKKMDYFVYVNGVKVWETDGATWTESTKANLEVANGIDLEYGDIVDFIVTGDVGDADPWGGAGNILFPLISWTKIIPKPVTSVNVVMNSHFALNAKVEIPVGVLTEVDTVGFLVNGEEVALTETGLGTYAANNILKAYVQDLATEKVTIQAYYKTTSGKTIKGAEITTNIIDVIRAYSNSTDEAVKALAVAALNYISEAQMYFDPNLTADELANAVLSEEDQLDYRDLDYNKYDDTVIVENENATVEFAGISMILNSATSLKFYIELPEDADVEDYYLVAMDPVTMQVTSAGVMAVNLKYTEDGKAVAYFGSTFENMDRLYAFAVVDADGELASDILVYSPLAYAANMANDLEVGYVCSALIALNDAIDAYTGAVATR